MSVCRRGVYDFSMWHAVFVIIVLSLCALIFIQTCERHVNIPQAFFRSIKRFSKSVLGRHSSSIKTTQAIYSRELAAAPARKLQDMIREIAEGRFFPDNSRSSYFPSQARLKAPSVREHVDKAGLKPPPVKIEISSSDESLPGEQESSESESTGSTSSSSDDGEAPPVVKRWRRAKVEASDQVWYVHAISGMLHLVASPEDVPMMLACGRPVNANYRKATKDEVCKGAECRTCRRNV